MDGTATVSWDFSNPADYTIDNTTVQTGYSELSKYDSYWIEDSFQDFNNSMEKTDVDLSSGNVTLKLNSNMELLDNGNFSSFTDGTDEWKYTVVGSAGAIAGGSWDGANEWWQIQFIDFNAALAYYANVWMNQTFTLPSEVKSINVSVLHNFTLGDESYSITNGTLASMMIKTPGNDTIILDDRGQWINKTDTEWVELHSDDVNIFNTTGNYTISLFAYIDSNVTNIQILGAQNGVFNYWDNASVKFTYYETKGTMVSDVFDAGSYVEWGNITWNETLPAGTDVKFWARAGNTSVPTDSIWSGWYGPYDDPGAALDLLNSRYFQYMVNLTTSFTNLTPVLDSVNISYARYHLRGMVETQDFTPAMITNWGIFTHSENLNGQSVTYRYSTDGGSLWSDMPPDGDLRPIAVSQGTAIRFRAILNTTDTVVTPRVLGMSIQYVTGNPVVTLSGVWSQQEAEAGEVIRLSVYFNNTAESKASEAWLSVYLDPKLEYVEDGSAALAALDSQSWNNVSKIYKFNFTNLAEGQYNFWLDARVSTGHEDGTPTSTILAIDYLDPLGNRVESFVTGVSNTIVSPELQIRVNSNVSAADVGDVILYRLEVNNTGSGSAPYAWVNGTLDDRLQYVDSDGGVLNGTEMGWSLTDLNGNGSRVIFLNLSLKDNVAQGAAVSSSYTVEYSDTVGDIRSRDSNIHVLLCRLRSDMAFEISSQSRTINPGESFVVTVYYNNTRYGAAESVEISMSIPENLIMEGSSAPGTEVGDAYVWQFEDVAPGAHSFTVTFRADDITAETSTEVLAASMKATDPIKGRLDTVMSNEVQIDIVRIITIWEKIYWPWSGLAIFIVISFLAYALWEKYKPIPPNIDDAFLIYKDGRLISHQKSIEHGKMRAELDGDIVSAMLTAVQQFVNDSLDETGIEKVRKLEFGDRELFMERGENIYLAILYSGSMNRKLDQQITELARKIEREFPGLAFWNGRMKGLEKVDDYLQELIDEWQRPDANSNGKNGAESADSPPCDPE